MRANPPEIHRAGLLDGSRVMRYSPFPVAVHKLDDDVGAHPSDEAVAQLLGCIGGSAAGSVRFDFVGRSVGDINAAAVGLPPGNARREMLVGVGDPAVVFFLELVFAVPGVGSRRSQNCSMKCSRSGRW